VLVQIRTIGFSRLLEPPDTPKSSPDAYKPVDRSNRFAKIFVYLIVKK